MIELKSVPSPRTPRPFTRVERLQASGLLVQCRACKGFLDAPRHSPVLGCRGRKCSDCGTWARV